MSVGWFSRRKFRMPDGRLLIVCPSCADMLRRETVVASGNNPKPEPSLFSRLSGKPEPRVIDYQNPEDLEQMLQNSPANGKTVVTIRTSTSTKTAADAEGMVLMRHVVEDMRDQPGISDEVLKQFDQALHELESKPPRSTKDDKKD